MEIIETKSGKTIKVTSRSIRKSVSHAHELIERGLPGAEAGPCRYDPSTDSIIETASGKNLGKLKRE
ncbi:MAG: hypothetical protein LBG82_08895 [Clostridiales Family XIII bacterium]|jgi:hypothetical protein|nr:hypothetical protein [Clostridiales Family XIII bacterium]